MGKAMTIEATQESMEMATTTLETFPPLDMAIASKPSTGAASSDGNDNAVFQTQEQQGFAVSRPVWAVPVREWREKYAHQDHGSAELWGPLLLKGALTLLVGQSSVGKSVLLYRLAEALATGREFLGLTPPRPLRVLHIDLETPDDVRNAHLEVMENPDGWDIVDRHPPTGALAEAAEQYDVVIVDSLQVYDPVNDEDNNSEANRQMTALVDIARQSNTSLLVTHNAGKVDAESAKSKFLGRGASARTDRSDIVINCYEPPKSKVPDARELRIVKSRHGYNNAMVSFRFEGELNYALIEGITLRVSKQAAILQQVRELMADGKKRKRQDIRDALEIIKDSPQDRQLSDVLKKATSKGLEMLEHEKGGFYSLKSSSVKGLEVIPRCIGGNDSKPFYRPPEWETWSEEAKLLYDEIANMPVRDEILEEIKIEPRGHRFSQQAH